MSVADITPDSEPDLVINNGINRYNDEMYELINKENEEVVQFLESLIKRKEYLSKGEKEEEGLSLSIKFKNLLDLSGATDS